MISCRPDHPRLIIKVFLIELACFFMCENIEYDKKVRDEQFEKTPKDLFWRFPCRRDPVSWSHFNVTASHAVN